LTILLYARFTSDLGDMAILLSRWDGEIVP
jgi:hypothetical protein